MEVRTVPSKTISRSRRKQGRSQKRFKSSYLQSRQPQLDSDVLTVSKKALKKPLEIPSENLIPWMDIFNPGNREVILHQALMKVRSRHPPTPTSKESGRLLYSRKSSRFIKRYGLRTATRERKTEGISVRATVHTASGPSLSNFSSPTHQEEMLSRCTTPKFLISGRTPKGANQISYVREGEDFLATTNTLETSKKSHRSNEKPKKERLKVTFFNSEVIPEKSEKKLTVSEIRHYIQYLDTLPFK